MSGDKNSNISDNHLLNETLRSVYNGLDIYIDYKKLAIEFYSKLVIDFKDHHFDLEVKKSGHFAIIIDKKNIKTLFSDSNYINFKKSVKNDIENNFVIKCLICYEIVDELLSCGQCANEICINCIIKIANSNKGTFSCPFCRFPISEKMNGQSLQFFLQCVRNKFS